MPPIVLSLALAAATLVAAVPGAARAVTLSFASPPDPDSSLAYNGDRLDGAFVLDTIVTTGRSGGDLTVDCRDCILDFTARGGVRSGNTWSFASGEVQIDGTSVGGVGTGGERIYFGDLGGLEVVALEDSLFSIVTGAHENGTFQQAILASLGLSSLAGSGFGGLDASFRGAFGDGFSASPVFSAASFDVGGVTEASPVPEPAGLLLIGMAAAGFMRRRR